MNTLLEIDIVVVLLKRAGDYGVETRDQCPQAKGGAYQSIVPAPIPPGAGAVPPVPEPTVPPSPPTPPP